MALNLAHSMSGGCLDVWAMGDTPFGRQTFEAMLLFFLLTASVTREPCVGVRKRREVW